MPKTSMARGHLSATFTILVWGTTFVASKLLLDKGFTPIEMLFLRFAIAYLVLALISWRPLSFAGWRQEIPFVVCGVFGVTLYFLAENTALLYTLVANVGILVTVAPFLTALLSWIIFKEPPSSSFLIGFVFAFVGVVLVSLNGTYGFKMNLIGDGLAILAAGTWAAYSVAMRMIGESGRGDDSILCTRRIFFYGLVSMVPLLFILGIDISVASFADPVVWGSVAFLALFGSALCYVTWNYAMRVLGEVRTSAYIYAIPAVTVISSMLVLGESISAGAVVGIVLITFGLVLSERGGRNAVKEPGQETVASIGDANQAVAADYEP